MHDVATTKPTAKTGKIERRVYRRVSMKDSSFTCHFEEGSPPCQLRNLSLSGCCVENPLEMQKGDRASVTISSNDEVFSTPLNLSATVTRTGKKSAALEFQATTRVTYMMLQAILLYHSHEPHLMASEFPEHPHLVQA